MRMLAALLPLPILIHTSVKLVTLLGTRPQILRCYFNPHEREARDHPYYCEDCHYDDFNPHEREARDIEILRCFC